MRPMLNDTALKLHHELGIPADYGEKGIPPTFSEATDLEEVGPNLVGRMQRLVPLAALRWRQLVEAAGSDGIRLLIVSGYRSFDYQAELIRNKIAAGQNIGDILTVNAAPGFSQHHSGAAVDVASPGSRPLTEEFEQSAAFEWLSQCAASHGFSMTYPRENQWGFIYEPWHWALEEAIQAETP